MKENDDAKAESNNELKPTTFQVDRTVDCDKNVERLISFLNAVLTAGNINAGNKKDNADTQKADTQKDDTKDLITALIKIYEQKSSQPGEKIKYFLASLDEINIFKLVNINAVFTQSLGEFFSHYPEHLPEHLKYLLPLNFDWITASFKDHILPSPTADYKSPEKPKLIELINQLKTPGITESQIFTIEQNITLGLYLLDSMRNIPEQELIFLFMYLIEYYKKKYNAFPRDRCRGALRFITDNMKYLSLDNYEKILLELLQCKEYNPIYIINELKFVKKRSNNLAVIAKASKLLTLLKVEDDEPITNDHAEDKAETSSTICDEIESYAKILNSKLQSNDAEHAFQERVDLTRIIMSDKNHLSPDVIDSLILTLVKTDRHKTEYVFNNTLGIIRSLLPSAHSAIYPEVIQSLMIHIEHQREVNDKLLDIIIIIQPHLIDADLKKKLASFLLNKLLEGEAINPSHKLLATLVSFTANLDDSQKLLIFNFINEFISHCKKDDAQRKETAKENDKINLAFRTTHPENEGPELQRNEERVAILKPMVDIMLIMLEKDLKGISKIIPLNIIIHLILNCIYDVQLASQASIFSVFSGRNSMLSGYWEKAGKVFAKFPSLEQIIACCEIVNLQNQINEEFYYLPPASLIAPIMATSPIASFTAKISRVTMFMPLYAQRSQNQSSLRTFKRSKLFDINVFARIFCFADIATKKLQTAIQQQDTAAHNAVIGAVENTDSIQTADMTNSTSSTSATSTTSSSSSTSSLLGRRSNLSSALNDASSSTPSMDQSDTESLSNQSFAFGNGR